MFELKTTALFIATAVAEIVGCYLPYLWLRHVLRALPTATTVPPAIPMSGGSITPHGRSALTAASEKPSWR